MTNAAEDSELGSFLMSLSPRGHERGTRLSGEAQQNGTVKRQRLVEAHATRRVRIIRIQRRKLQLGGASAGWAPERVHWPGSACCRAVLKESRRAVRREKPRPTACVRTWRNIVHADSHAVFQRRPGFALTAWEGQRAIARKPVDTAGPDDPICAQHLQSALNWSGF